MKHHIVAAALAVVTIAAGVASADDAWDQSAQREIEYFKKYSKKAKDDHQWADLVQSVVGTQHPMAAEELGRILLRDKSVEHQMIVADALSEFVDKKESKDAAGTALLEALQKGKFEVDVVDSIVNSLGILEHKPATLPICDLLAKGGDPYLLVTAVRALGRINDIRALPTLLELWERHPVGYSWETGSVTVDTGASGTADQEAAEAAWQAAYGNVRPRGKPPMMLKIYIQELAKSVKLITGAEIAAASELRTWMEEHVEELTAAGVEIPKYKGGAHKEPEDEGGKKKK